MSLASWSERRVDGLQASVPFFLISSEEGKLCSLFFYVLVGCRCISSPPKANALSLSYGFICLTFTICLSQVPYDDNVCAGLVTRCSFLPMWSLSSAWELILMYLAPGDLLPPLDTMWVGYDGRMGVLFVSLFLDID